MYKDVASESAVMVGSGRFFKGAAMQDINTVRTAVLESLDTSALPQRPFDEEFIPVICGSMLCRLRVWTEEEWAYLADTERPASFVHAPGVGWVGAESDCSQN